MPDYRWPEASQRSLIGKRHSRVDGPDKVSGRAKYTHDVKRPGMLYGTVVRCPDAHAKIVSVDTSAAEKMPGVKGVYVINGPGTEAPWVGFEVVALAATEENLARDAARAVKVQYERLPHVVEDRDPAAAGDRVKPAEEQSGGDVAKGFQEAEVTVEGNYGIPLICHCTLEPHGSVTEWDGDKLNVFISTQAVSSIAEQMAEPLNIQMANIHVHQDHVGGGFGSKFGPDVWDIAGARLAKATGKPVKLMNDRESELNVAGCRPSTYATVKVGAKKDGTITAWESKSWGTGGMTGGGAPPIPYVWRFPFKTGHASIDTNLGAARAWRAPNHPQACYVTMSALEDLAAGLKMDPLDLFLKNIEMTGPRAALYREELLKAAELSDWKKKWHPRGDSGTAPVKRGMGLSLHTWGGLGHESECRLTINPDGSVSAELGSQDLGTGTRTVIAIVAAETLGLPVSAIQVKIGDTSYPPSGSSGGSTTVGGVSASTRRAAVDARDALFKQVAGALGADPANLEAAGGNIRVKGNPAKSMTWKQACAKIGVSPISVIGKRLQGKDELINQGVGGVQVAEVSVDTETGIVKVEKMVAVQDTGLIINAKTAESQVLGALIMGISYSLFEEKIMDRATGRMMNANMESYRLAGIADVGNLVVHMMTGKPQDDRGVIGLGEPPVVSPGAAIANAVANAIGVRVSNLPLTPDRVLAALQKKGGLS